MIEPTREVSSLNQQAATISPEQVRQAKAMLIIHFAIEKRFGQATATHGRMPGEEMERQGDDWELLEVVLKALNWSEKQRQELNARCEKIRETEVRLRGGEHPGIPKIPGVSYSAMLIHYDVCAKEKRIRAAMKPRAWRILKLMLEPVARGKTYRQIRLRSLREVAGIFGSSHPSGVRGTFARSLEKAARILVLNSDD